MALLHNFYKSKESPDQNACEKEAETNDKSIVYECCSLCYSWKNQLFC